MIRNALFSQFASLVNDRFADDFDLISQVSLAEAVHGVSLDDLYAEQPALALRLRKAMQTVANDIASGLASIPDGANGAPSVRRLFSDLSKLLDRFHPEE